MFFNTSGTNSKQNQIDTKPSCPNCGVVLNKVPKRKSKCLSCNNYMYVRASQKLFPETVLTKKQAKAVDDYFELLAVVTSSGFSEKEFFKMQGVLRKKFGTEPGYGDVIWSLYNQELLRSNDLSKMKSIYYSMALFLNREGRDHSTILEAYHKTELEIYKLSGHVEKVSILSNVGCAECAKQNGMVFTLKNALKYKHLPCKNCTHILYKGKEPFCRCLYVPES